MPDIPQSVLYICNFNAIRSPMAAALTRFYGGPRLYVASAGIRAEDESANAFAIAVMAELDIDLSAHVPTRLDALMDQSFDLVVSLSPEAHHKALDMTRTLDCPVEYWPTLDPTAVTGHRNMILDAFRQTRQMLEDKIKKRFVTDYFPKV